MAYLWDELVESALRPIMIQGLQQVRCWFERADTSFLRCVFQQVGFFPQDKIPNVFYAPPRELTLRINYPIKQDESFPYQLKSIKEKTWALIKDQYGGLQDDYLNPLSSAGLLFLLEKLGGNIPFEGNETVSIYDAQKVRAFQSILSLNRSEKKHGPGVLLIAADISGIQKFIYNISSAKAMKNLRARSFFIELLSQHATKRILKAFHLHPINVLIKGGGNTVILASKPDDYKELLDNLDYSLNSWLAKTLDYRLNVVIVAKEASDHEVSGDISTLLKDLSILTFQKKARKAEALIAQDEFKFIDEADPTTINCEVCQKDIGDQRSGRTTSSDDVTRCQFCETLVRIGNLIPKARYVFVSQKGYPKTIEIEDTNYLLSATKESLPCAWAIFDDRPDLIADLDFAEEVMLAGNYAVLIQDLPGGIKASIEKQKAEIQARLKEEKEEEEIQDLSDELAALSDENMAQLEHLASCSEGSELIGALRMDADNIGKILQKGFYSAATIAFVSSLSRNLNYFFKIYLNSMCQGRVNNPDNRSWVHVIYSGGDDLFVLGAWDHIADLSIKVGDAFSSYTSESIDLGLSAGFTIHKPKYPVSKMAAASLSALHFSKECLEPCWFCREDWLDCPLFRKDGSCLRKGALTPFFVESKAAIKQRLDKETIRIYTRHTSRLKLSFKRALFSGSLEQKRDEVQDLILEPMEVFSDPNVPHPPRGFLHNVLKLLDVWYKDGLLYFPQVVWLLEKQKIMLQKALGKETGSSTYERYKAALHLVSREMLSALHVPLTWAILLKKEGGKTDDS